jgi:hypothetical protein
MPYKHSRYLRIRVRKPTDFKPGSFRTQDIGRKGHSKRIAGRLKGSRKYATQAFLVNKKDVGSMPTRRLIKTVRRLYPRATISKGGAK